MKYNTSVQYGRKRGDGAVEISEGQIIVYYKSAAIHYAFGAIGTAIAQGKEILRFSVNDIESYNIINRAFTDELCITLKNGETVTIGLKRDLKECLLPILEKAVAANSELKSDKKKVYVCRICNTYSKNKLKTCPYCRAIDTMIERDVDANAEIDYYESSSDANTNDIKKQSYCRKCGFELIEGSSFCRKCGAAIFDLQSESEKTALSGKEIMAEKQTTTKVVPIVKDLKPRVSDTAIEIDFSDNHLPPKVKRAFLFIEDGEWEKADSYLESVLDEDPTNAYAYIGKLLIDYRVSKPSDLLTYNEVIGENKNYLKALRFSDKTLAIKLDALKQQKEAKLTNSRVPVQVDGGTIWVSLEVAQKIAKGEIDLNKKLAPEEEQAVLDAALSFMNFDK